MKRTGKVALGRFGRSGKQHLVALRPYRDALVLQQLYYADEVHSIDDVNFPRNVAFRPVEEELADKLIEQLSTEKFEPEKYHDEYRDRVEKAVDQKVSGEEISIMPEQPAAQIIDLFEALKRSLGNKPSAPAPMEEQEAPAYAAVASSELSMDKPLKKAAPARKTGREKEKAGVGILVWLRARPARDLAGPPDRWIGAREPLERDRIGLRDRAPGDAAFPTSWVMPRFDP
jgi:DNA end-binding protein Ku